MVLLRYFVILISLGILFSSDETLTEKAGDIMQLAIPLAGLGSTYVIDDKIGKKQFWKSYLSTAFLTYFLKITINRERPSGGGWSFPSGHTASAFSGAMFINNRYGAKYGIPSLLLASFVGYSRVHADKHYWGDVMAGASIGIASNMIFTKKGEQLNSNRLVTLQYIPIANRIKFNFKLK
mgnify:CR=1 FL=1